MNKAVRMFLSFLAAFLCVLSPLSGRAQGNSAIYVDPSARFSFAYDPAYTVEWDDDSAATIYTDSVGYIPFALVWLAADGDTTGFDSGEFFDVYTEDMQSSYGSSLLSVEEGLSMQLGDAVLPGAKYVYLVSGHTVEMMVFLHDTGNSLRQFTCKYLQGQGDATIAAMAKAISTFQLLSADGTPPADKTQSTPTDTQSPSPGASPLSLVDVDGGFFSLKLPENWQYVTMGEYSSFGFRAWDPQNADYQVFYYGTLTPLLKSEAAKEWNRKLSKLVQPGSTYHFFADTPAVDLNDVSTLFYAWPELITLVERYAGTWIQPGFSFPKLRNFAVIDKIPLQTLYAGMASDEAIVTASFQSEGGANCFGKFSASLVPMQPYYVDNIDQSLAAAWSVAGVMAPQGDFLNVEQSLSEAVYSLTFTEEYVQEGNAYAQKTAQTALSNMKAIQDVYDRYNAAWRSYITGNTLLYIDSDGAHLY